MPKTIFFASCVFAILALPTEGGDQVIESKSTDFVVHCFSGGPQASKVLDLCQSLRAKLSKAWLPNAANLPQWNPPCNVWLHRNRVDYVRAVGEMGAQTEGSSQIRMDARGVSLRRIDLLVSEHGELSALPHELTHVVLADCFGGRAPPHWLDEGAAMLADTIFKQSLHERDCRHALRAGKTLPLSQILRLEEFTSAEQMPPFYGQSASLLRFFVNRGGTEKIMQFGLDARKVGYPKALHEHYGIESESELERLWKAFETANGPISDNPPILVVSYRP